jgi:hypothetical protein
MSGLTCAVDLARMAKYKEKYLKAIEEIDAILQHEGNYTPTHLLMTIKAIVVKVLKDRE